MPSRTARSRARWGIPVAAGLLIAAAAGYGAVGASADAGLPERTAQQLLVDLQSPRATALSGTVEVTADLGLPALPTGMMASSDLTSLASGTSTLRVWTDGADRARTDLLASGEETGVYVDGREVWIWSSSDQTATRMTLPEHSGDEQDQMDVSDLDLPTTPAQAAERLLVALDDSTTVTTSGTARVAGRAAYELLLTPRDPSTLVDRVAIAIDAETNVPLRVEVFSTQMPEPAYQVAFTSVDFAAPDAAVFAFTPPSGATVTDQALPAGGAAGAKGAMPDGMAQPVVVGDGWSRILIATVPDGLGSAAADAGRGDGGMAALALLESLPATSGPWGTGRVLSGTLVSMIITDDGTVAIGAVGPQALGDALAAR